MDIEVLRQKRLRAWCQDGEHRVPDATAAAAFIERVGMATLYSASSEVPNLLWAYVSEAGYVGEPTWDSPSGDVYGWRWDLGKPRAAFYGALVAKKPTWIAWDVLPLVLGFAMERRDPEALYADGLLSFDAIKVVRAFGDSSGVLSTKELRRLAGFPTGKAERAAYLKAIEELDSRLLLAKTFDEAGEGDDMSHALIGMHYASFVEEGMRFEPSQALELFLRRYLPGNVYFAPKVLAKHLRLPAGVMDRVVCGLVASGFAFEIDGLVVTKEEE